MKFWSLCYATLKSRMLGLLFHRRHVFLWQRDPPKTSWQGCRIHSAKSICPPETHVHLEPTPLILYYFLCTWDSPGIYFRAHVVFYKGVDSWQKATPWECTQVCVVFKKPEGWKRDQTDECWTCGCRSVSAMNNRKKGQRVSPRKGEV